MSSASTTALVLAVLLGGACSPGSSDAILVRDVHAYILGGEPRWEVVEQSSRAPKVTEFSPPGESGPRGRPRREVRRTLLMPPPARVRFEVRPDEDGTSLCGATALRTAGEDEGVDPASLPPWIVFEVRVDGELVDSRRASSTEPADWAAVGGSRGIPVRAGAVIELATRCEGDDGNAVVPTLSIPAGFGQLRLERQREVPRARSSPEQPNLVLLVQDTLRRDRLSTYGYERETSPTLDRLAADGVVFDEAYATSSWTWPSTTSILTGLLPERHGVTSENACYVDAKLQLLPEALQRVGFTTGAFSANALIQASKNFDQGFETFVGQSSGFAESSDLVPKALEWVRENAGRRFFLYLHLADTHGLTHTLPEARERFAADVPGSFDPNEFRRYSSALREARLRPPNDQEGLRVAQRKETRKAVNQLYDAAVYSGDLWLERLLGTLEEVGVTEKTIVAFTSDHGEELYDHGALRHGHSLYGELVRVPLVIRGPGVARGVRVTTPISNRHIAPTLARLGGVVMEGPIDALDLLAGELPERPVFFSTEHGLWKDVPGRTTIRGVRDGDWVLHFSGKADARLFRFGVDPLEAQDVAPANETRVESLRELVEERGSLSRRPDGVDGAGELTLELLEGIGYIGE